MQLYDIGSNSDVLNPLIANTVLVTFATVAVVLRLYARWMRKVPLWVDDYSIIACLGICFALYGIQIAYSKLGMRVHITEIPAENLELMLKILVVYQILWGTSLLLGKMSYLFFYKRIFVIRGFLIAIWVILGIVVAWYIANILQVFLICHPFESNWNVHITAVCGNRPAAFTVIGAINMLQDLAIIALPIPFVRKLQMPTSSKIGICMIFAIGLLICIISIIRMVVLSQLDFNDISYDMLPSVYWTVTEPALLIINSCIPTVKPVVAKIFNIASWMQSKQTYASNKTSGNFGRLHDEYPLTNSHGGQHSLTITGGAEATDADSNDERSDRRFKAQDVENVAVNEFSIVTSRHKE